MPAGAGDKSLHKPNANFMSAFSVFRASHGRSSSQFGEWHLDHPFTDDAAMQELQMALRTLSKITESVVMLAATE
jgi:hypothetical protein